MADNRERSATSITLVLLFTGGLLSLVVFTGIPTLWGGDSVGYTGVAKAVARRLLLGEDAGWDLARPPVYPLLTLAAERIFGCALPVSPGDPACWGGLAGTSIVVLQLVFCVASTLLLGESLARISPPRHPWLKSCVRLTCALVIALPVHAKYARFLLPETLGYIAAAIAVILLLRATSAASSGLQLQYLPFAQSALLVVGTLLKPALAPLLFWPWAATLWLVLGGMPGLLRRNRSGKGMALTAFLLAALPLTGWIGLQKSRNQHATLSPIGAATSLALVYDHLHLLKSSPYLRYQLTAARQEGYSPGVYMWIALPRISADIDAGRFRLPPPYSTYPHHDHVAILYYMRDAAGEAIRSARPAIYRISASRVLNVFLKGPDGRLPAQLTGLDPLPLPTTTPRPDLSWMERFELLNRLGDQGWTGALAAIPSLSLLATMKRRRQCKPNVYGFIWLTLIASLLSYLAALVAVGWHESRYNYPLIPSVMALAWISLFRLLSAGQIGMDSDPGESPGSTS